MVEQLLPGLLPVVHTALVHVQNEVGPGEPRPHIVGKHWSFPCGHAHGHIMEPHLAHAGHLDAGRIQQRHPPVVVTPRIQADDTSPHAPVIHGPNLARLGLAIMVEAHPSDRAHVTRTSVIHDSHPFLLKRHHRRRQHRL